MSAPQQQQAEPDRKDAFINTVDNVISDLIYIRNTVPISAQNAGKIAGILGRLAYELRCAEDMLT